MNAQNEKEELHPEQALADSADSPIDERDLGVLRKNKGQGLLAQTRLRP